MVVCSCTFLFLLSILESKLFFVNYKTQFTTAPQLQWLKYGGTQFPHLQFLVQSVPPPQISKKTQGNTKENRERQGKLTW